MEKEICLDTDIIIELTRKNIRVRDSLEKIEGMFYTTPITFFEVYFGLFDHERFPPINCKKITKHDGILAGKIQKDLKSKGEIMDIRDLFIACICINNNMILLSRNIKHFKRFEKYGLKIMTV